MRIKVGNSWYAGTRGWPIMAEFSEEDKAHLRALLNDPAMTGKDIQLALFSPEDGWAETTCTAWMDARGEP